MEDTLLRIPFVELLLLASIIFPVTATCVASDKQSQVEFVYQGLFGNYDESFPRTTIANEGLFATPNTRDFEFDCRYFLHINRTIGIGASLHSLSFKGHGEIGILSGHFIDDASTK